MLANNYQGGPEISLTSNNDIYNDWKDSKRIIEVTFPEYDEGEEDEYYGELNAKLQNILAD